MQYNSAMQLSFEEVRQLAMQLQDNERVALAMELYADLPMDTSGGIAHDEVASDIANVLRSANSFCGVTAGFSAR